MAGPYLKEWRSHLGLTQKQVVDRLSMYDDPTFPTTEASLSRIETGKQPWAKAIVEAPAVVYGIEVDDLMSRNPLMEKERAEAIAKGGKVVDIRDFQFFSDSDKQRLIRMWNVMHDQEAG